MEYNNTYNIHIYIYPQYQFKIHFLKQWSGPLKIVPMLDVTMHVKNNQL